MDLDIEIDGWPKSYDWADLAEAALEAVESVEPALANERLTASLLFTVDEEVRTLNREWRTKDKPTNVLSFPMLTRAELLATPIPAGPPDNWTLIQRARASFDPLRSGDFYVMLKPRITPIADPSRGSVATHGSVWDYDRRVPILFWRRGLTGFEQPLAVETVDIMPTLAALIGLPLAPGSVDGRCLDLIAGPGTSCPN